jgi:short-subunit dehydrogenase
MSTTNGYSQTTQSTADQRVLITGASSGIGLELAREFARNGHPLVITATGEAELDTVARDLTDTHGVDVLYVGQDLAQPDSAKQLFDALKAKNIEIEILINNAGVGHKGKFWEQSPESHTEMIRLNIEAVVSLTRQFLPEMIERGHGRILNTASIAGFMPAPLMAVYHATKAFVLSFSEAVATELNDTGVTLTALCPGATDTDFFERAGAVESTMFQKGNVMAPQEVAEGGYHAVVDGDRVYVAGGINKAMVASRRILPESVLAKMTEFFYSDVKPDDHKREPGDVAAKHESS